MAMVAYRRKGLFGTYCLRAIDAHHHHGGEHGTAAGRHGDGAAAGGRESI